MKITHLFFLFILSFSLKGFVQPVPSSSYELDQSLKSTFISLEELESDTIEFTEYNEFGFVDSFEKKIHIISKSEEFDYKKYHKLILRTKYKTYESDAFIFKPGKAYSIEINDNNLKIHLSPIFLTKDNIHLILVNLFLYIILKYILSKLCLIDYMFDKKLVVLNLLFFILSYVLIFIILYFLNSFLKEVLIFLSIMAIIEFIILNNIYKKQGIDKSIRIFAFELIQLYFLFLAILLNMLLIG